MPRTAYVFYCPKCKSTYSAEVYKWDEETRCSDCQTFLIPLNITLEEWNKKSQSEKDFLKTEFQKSLDKKEERRIQFEQELRSRKSNFIATTTPTIEGYRITKYLGICSGESTVGTGIFSEANALAADFWGTEAKGYSSKLGQAKNNALMALMRNAFLIGADAVVGVDIDIMTVGNNMMLACANGTAVTTEKI